MLIKIFYCKDTENELKSYHNKTNSEKFFTDAGFLTVVEVGQYFMTQDTAEFSQFTDAVACREYTLPRDEDTSEPVDTIPPIQQNPMQNGYDENKGYDESYENKCATNYSIITNNNWNDTHDKHAQQVHQ